MNYYSNKADNRRFKPTYRPLKGYLREPLQKNALHDTEV